MTWIGVGVLVGAMVGALLLHVLFFRAVFRWGWTTPTSRQVQHRLRWPARSLTILVAAVLVVPAVPAAEPVTSTLVHTLLIGIVVTLGWLSVRALRLVEDTLLARLDVSGGDNLYARRRLTQVTVLRRVATVVILILVAAGVLLTFDRGRSVGASVLASAGVIGIVAGIAARPTLGNLLAGLQIVFAEPIRLDDVVVVEGEWGNIEEITLAHVVVRLWDRRRLVLPSAYFVEQPFQNWTRRNAQVIGAVSLFLDYRAPVDGLRRELQRLLDASERWDGEVSVLQVVDATEETIHVRVLASAVDAPTSWDLRCELREGLIGWLCDEHPEALPTRRVEPTSSASHPRPSLHDELLQHTARHAEAHMADAGVGPGRPPSG